MTLAELHAQADALLPPEQHPRLNTLIKEQPAFFYVNTRLVKLPKGTTTAKLKRLADAIYLAKQREPEPEKYGLGYMQGRGAS